MQDDTFDDEDRYDPAAPAPPSKSQRKREATASQEVGEHLVRLTPAQLKQIPLPDELLAAVRLAQTITQAGGNLISNGVVLHTHKHGGVQAGGSQTGTPV